MNDHPSALAASKKTIYSTIVSTRSDGSCIGLQLKALAPAVDAFIYHDLPSTEESDWSLEVRRRTSVDTHRADRSL